MRTFLKKPYLYVMSFLLVLCMSLASCGSSDSTESSVQKLDLADGTYQADFKTDNSMFHINEAYDNKGILTVKDGQGTIHITLPSKKILNLFPGLAEDAQKEGAVLLEPTTDLVTYSDGETEEVYGFDVPVPVLGEEFDLALIGTKGVWYDHKVSVSNPEPYDASESSAAETAAESASQTSAETTAAESREAESTKAAESAASANAVSTEALADGSYEIELDFEGGSGKAYINSPAKVTISGGAATATVEWSSPNYDYMLVNGEKYMPVNTDGNSVFEIPVVLDEPMTVIGDTVAMSKPHEIEYTLTFHSESAK